MRLSERGGLRRPEAIEGDEHEPCRTLASGTSDDRSVGGGGEGVAHQATYRLGTRRRVGMRGDPRVQYSEVVRLEANRD